MRARLDLEPALVARAAGAALAAGIVALLLLSVLLSVLVGDAGSDWGDPGPKASLWVGLQLASVLAGSAAGAVGTWQAAEAGAPSKGAAMLAGGAVPAVVLVVLGIVAGGLSGASVVSALALALGTGLGAWRLARRLG